MDASNTIPARKNKKQQVKGKPNAKPPSQAVKVVEGKQRPGDVTSEGSKTSAPNKKKSAKPTVVPAPLPKPAEVETKSIAIVSTVKQGKGNRRGPTDKVVPAPAPIPVQVDLPETNPPIASSIKGAPEPYIRPHDLAAWACAFTLSIPLSEPARLACEENEVKYVHNKTGKGQMSHHPVSATTRTMTVLNVIRREGKNKQALRVLDYYGSARNKFLTSDAAKHGLTLDFVNAPNTVIAGDGARISGRVPISGVFDLVMIQDVFYNGFEPLRPDHVTQLCRDANVSGKVYVLTRTFIGEAGIDESLEGAWYRDEQDLIVFSPDKAQSCYAPHPDLNWLIQRSIGELDIADVHKIGPYHIYLCTLTGERARGIGKVRDPASMCTRCTFETPGHWSVLDHLPTIILDGVKAGAGYLGLEINKAMTVRVAQDIFTKYSLSFNTRVFSGGALDTLTAVVQTEFSKSPKWVAFSERFPVQASEIKRGTVSALAYHGRMEIARDLSYLRTAFNPSEYLLIQARTTARPDAPTSRRWWHYAVPLTALFLCKFQTFRDILKACTSGVVRTVTPNTIQKYIYGSVFSDCLDILRPAWESVKSVVTSAVSYLPGWAFNVLVAPVLEEKYRHTWVMRVFLGQEVLSKLVAVGMGYVHLPAAPVATVFLNGWVLGIAAMHVVFSICDIPLYVRYPIHLAINVFATWGLPPLLMWLMGPPIPPMIPPVIAPPLPPPVASVVTGMDLTFAAAAVVIGLYVFFRTRALPPPSIPQQWLDARSQNIDLPGDEPWVGPLPNGTALDPVTVIPGYTPDLYRPYSKFTCQFYGNDYTLEEILDLLPLLTPPPTVAKQYMMVATNANMYQPANNLQNLLAAITFRLLVDPFPGQTVSSRENRHIRWRKLAVFIVSIARKYGEIDRLEPEECYALMGSRGKRLLTEHISAHATGNAAPYAKSVNVKADEVLAPKTSDGRFYIKPRAVVNYDPRTLSILAPYTRAMDAKLHEMFSEVNVQTVSMEWSDIVFTVVYASGYDPERLTLLRAMIATSEIPVIVVSGDDSFCWNLWRTGTWIEGDMTKCDHSQDTGPMVIFDGHVMEQGFNVPREIVDLIIKTASSKYRVRKTKWNFNIEFETDPQLGTGINCTTWCNSLHVAVGFIYHILCVARGDSEPTVSALTRDMYDLGFTIKAMEHLDPRQVTFLKGWWVPATTATGVSTELWVPLPSCVLKLGKFLRDPRVITGSDTDALEKCAYATLRSFGHMPAGYPIVSAFFEMLGRVGRPTDLKLDLWRTKTITYSTDYFIDTEAVYDMIYNRYGITKTDSRDVEKLYDLIMSLPSLVVHHAFIKLRDVDYG